MDDHSNVETTYTQSSSRKQDPITSKYILEEISKNTRELENFFNLNLKLRNYLNEIVQSYLSFNEDSKTKKINSLEMKNHYNSLKECLKALELNTNQFYNNVLNKSALVSSHQYCTRDDFNSVYSEKNKEINESLLKYEFHYKYNFTISIFRPLLEYRRDEILREVVKEDYHGKIINSFQTGPSSTFINEIPASLIEEINKKYFSTLNIAVQDTKTQSFKNMTVNVFNSFIILIQVSNEFHFYFKMTVYSSDERTKYSPSYIRKERKFINLTKKFKPDDKSSFKVIRKISQLLEDRLYILLRYGKIPFKIGFYLFITWLANYNDLFKKKCAQCKRIAKYNPIDKCFYPPLYKFMDLESDNFFHEECYNFMNSSPI